jgi:hypothetical protein
MENFRPFATLNLKTEHNHNIQLVVQNSTVSIQMNVARLAPPSLIKLFTDMLQLI